MEPFHAEHDPKPLGRIYLAVLAVITPAAFYAVHVWWDRDGKVPVAFPYLCLGTVLYLLICQALAMTTCKGRERWIILDGEISYESPLGGSFRMPLSEFQKVENDGDSNLAFCVSKTGVRHRFDTNQPGGSEFYRRLKQEQKRLSEQAAGQ